MTIEQALMEIDRLRDLLAWNGINPDAIVESARGAARKVLANEQEAANTPAA